MKIITSAHNNYNYQAPIIDFKDLVHLKDQIVVISGGKDSHIFDLLKRHKVDEAEKRIDKFLSLFKDDFVLEVQKTNRVDEHEYFTNVVPMSSRKGIPIIATNDVLFAESKDFDTHETKAVSYTHLTLPTKRIV